MVKEQDVSGDFSSSIYYQSYLPMESDLDRMFIEEQLRKKKQLEEKYPGLERSFDAMLFTQFYFFTPGELGGNTPEFPLGAMVERFGDTKSIFAYAQNSTNNHRNSLDHAEKVAIEESLEKAGSKHLPKDSVLVTMVEPCAMCAGALCHAGGHTIIYAVSQQEMRDKTFVINGERKPFRTEPEGYTVEEFMKARNPESQVFGGYRKYEVLNFFNFWQEGVVMADGQKPRTFSLHDDVF